MARATKDITVSVSQHKPDFEVCPAGTMLALGEARRKLDAILNILKDANEEKPVFGGVYVYRADEEPEAVSRARKEAK